MARARPYTNGANTFLKYLRATKIETRIIIYKCFDSVVSLLIAQRQRSSSNWHPWSFCNKLLTGNGRNQTSQSKLLEKLPSDRASGLTGGYCNILLYFPRKIRGGALFRKLTKRKNFAPFCFSYSAERTNGQWPVRYLQLLR